MDKMKSMQEGKIFPFIIELDDPLSNCFIYNPLAPEEDPQIVVTIYDRTVEQEDELGISDMNC
jgi:zinc finger protein